jgi:hypothetical protein
MSSTEPAASIQEKWGFVGLDRMGGDIQDGLERKRLEVLSGEGSRHLGMGFMELLYKLHRVLHISLRPPLVVLVSPSFPLDKVLNSLSLSKELRVDNFLYFVFFLSSNFDRWWLFYHWVDGWVIFYQGEEQDMKDRVVFLSACMIARSSLS